MKLLYNRVFLRKIIDESFDEAPSVLKHHLSHDMRKQEVSKGEVVFTGVKCEEVEVGMTVMYPTKLEKFAEVNGEKFVDLREDLILGILNYNKNEK
jgi:hypothetical protein